MKDRCEALTRLLRQSRRVVFFGGAGVSTESGIKDYRSKDGLYNTVKEYGVPPETILSRSFFLKNPEIFYDFYYKYFLSETPAPNPAHLALAKLERMGKLTAVITQNIDGLHQAAGSRNVLELHGTISTYHCIRCCKPYPVEDVAALHGGVPRCPHCGGLIHPDVVLYEEGLDDATVDAAINALAAADLLIIGGTSLAVYPAASFLRFFGGEHIVLINRDATPYDDRAELIFRESIGQVLKSATERL
ncbi:MAG: NAD-dependent protein deacylase [Clostridia bacterium]|nr:NAD-dependent protein deacylase [Clostridia bacterium]